ncbi:hypothetical protein [Corynebacterium sanguinis]|uniref:hypothetical protein n=1 Tax=Corynebacterium sanguinis TaxID=2594913 RepID=UPI0028832180|nr:hypothetical protein [Corynebacterium sanguinis]
MRPPSFACCQTVRKPDNAFLQQTRASRSVDRAINTTAATHLIIRCVNDRIYILGSNITVNGL